MPETANAQIDYDFIKHLATLPLFFKLPEDQPPFAKDLAGKVVTGQKLFAMLNHAIDLTKHRDLDHTAAENERIMARSTNPQYHAKRSFKLRQQAIHRDAIASTSCTPSSTRDAIASTSCTPSSTRAASLHLQPSAPPPCKKGRPRAAFSFLSPQA